MQLQEQLNVMIGADRVRIYKDGNVAYSGYLGCMEHHDTGIDKTAEVIRLAAVPEIRHAKWEQLGLMQPFNPKETPDYKFSDLQMTLYYDIYI